MCHVAPEPARAIMISTTPVMFAMTKEGSLYIHLMHPAAPFGENPFCPAEYQEKITGFVGYRIVGINPNAIIVKDELWVWLPATAADDIVNLTTYFDDPANKGIMYVQQQNDMTKRVDTPVLIFMPAGLVEWLLIAQRSPWVLHKKT